MFNSPVRRQRTPPVDELFLTELLDRLSEENPQICTLALKNKAIYLLDQVKGIISRSARESLIFFPPSNPLCGIGLYGHVYPYVEEEDRLVAKFCLKQLPVVNWTPTNLITMTIAQGNAKFECDSAEVATDYIRQIRNTLHKLRVKEKLVELKPYYAGISMTQDGPTIYLWAYKSLQTLDIAPK
jgi:hypothetical protein